MAGKKKIAETNFGRNLSAVEGARANSTPTGDDKSRIESDIRQFYENVGEVKITDETEDVVEMGVGMMLHAGAEVDEPAWPLDERGQDVGRERVDREDMRQAVGSEAMSFAVAYRRIVDHGVEAPQRIDLGGNVLCAGNGLDDDVLAVPHAIARHSGHGQDAVVVADDRGEVFVARGSDRTHASAADANEGQASRAWQTGELR